MGPPADRVRIEVLGPLRVVRADGRDLTPDGPLQRRLLALLVLRRDRAVAVDSAIDVLWPSRPPRDPVAALHNQVFRLRRRLPAGVIESASNGYRLDASRIDLDTDELAAALHAGEPGGAALAALEAALEGWRGPAYVELDDVDEARIESTRLEELRVQAIEVRAEHRLRNGEADRVVAELAALADAEPLRERPRSLLMAALAQSGRQVEALRVYDDFRRLLGDELGIEPSPVLTAQHAALLAAADQPAVLPATRLAAPPTSLVGRDELVDEVGALVERHRVVTLVGPGGVGKTRLALEVGRRLAAERAERPVVWCELAPADAASALDAIAAALGIDARLGTALADRVASVIGDREVVLLLDNCEHVLDPVAALVDRVLGRCQGARVLATSRERLRLPGERVCAVPALAWEGRHGPAVELFVERARAVAPGFSPRGDELAAVTEIVRRLDGLPLAIELAAACLHTYDVAEVAAGLDERFSLLSSGFRSSSRHGSLRAAVAWSYGLLDAPLQETFDELSVFAGSFTAADAAAVRDSKVTTASEALSHLTERSLVLRTPGRRYVLLETLRAFGAERLAATGRAEAVAERHARHWVGWAEGADERLGEPDTRGIAEIDEALPELRAALGWLVDHGDAVAAGRLVHALFGYGFLAQRPDVLAWSNRVRAADPENRSPLAPQMWAISAYAAWMLGELALTKAHSERALAISQQRDDPPPVVVTSICGSYQLFEGRMDEALRWYRTIDLSSLPTTWRVFVASTELLALAYAGDPTLGERAAALLAEVGTATLPHVAYAWYCAGEGDVASDPEQARARLGCAIELAGATGAELVAGLAGASKASIDARTGDPQAAAAEYRRLVAHWRRSGVWSTQWTMLRSIAVLLERLGRRHDAAVLEGAVRATTAGHRIFGEDETMLSELSARLRAGLGDGAYEAALGQGAMLDGDAAVEHAVRSL